ncbi:hypothetical protein [Limnobacter sp.]|uniref:hypothetical protein n=1 Tax=Limnobacter sp. TaxID=2003368 RepID=UPI002FE1FA76
MTKVVRILCMWLMLFALPVQGMAQVGMFACHLQGDATGPVQTMDHGLMDHASMDHSMHAVNADPDPDSSKQVMKSLHGCCNCAPTCAVVLLPVAQASFGSIQHDTLHAVSVSQLPHSADTRRIDRPPKTLAI